MTDTPVDSNEEDPDLAAYRSRPFDIELATLRRLANRVVSTRSFPRSLAVDILEHAVALGLDTTDHGLAKQLSTLGSGLSTPWQPAPPSGELHWSAQSAIAGHRLLTTDSPRVGAWFLEQDGRIEEVIIIGRGTLRVRSVLSQVVLNAALALPRDASALLLDGLVWITSDTFADIAASGRAAWGTDERELVSDVFMWLRIQLETLQQESALVTVTSIPQSSDATTEIVRDKLGDLARRARSEKRNLVLAHRSQTNALSAVLPVKKTGSPIPFGVQLPADLLTTPAFQLLYDRTLEESLRRTRLHAHQRLDFYRDHLAQHQQQRRFYESLSERERRDLDRENVIINSIIDYQLATTVAMAVQKTIPGHVFYNQNLVSLIELDREWVGRMTRIINSVDRNLDRNKSGTRRLVAAQLLDMVVRDLYPTDPELRAPFEAFQRLARPYLLRRVYQACKAAGVDPERLRGRRLVFGLNITEAGCSLRPYWVWTSDTGVIEVSGAGDIARVIDYCDTVSSVPAPTRGTAPAGARPTFGSLLTARDEEAIVSEIRARLLESPTNTVSDFISTQKGLFSDAAYTGAAGGAYFEPLEALSDAHVLLNAGAIGPALRLLMEASAIRTSLAAVLPETVVEVLQLLAAVYGQSETMWETLKHWRDEARTPIEVRPVVKVYLQLLEQIEPGYFTQCVDHERVVTSPQMSQLLDTLQNEPLSQTRMRERRSRRAVKTCVAIRNELQHKESLPTGRNLYKRLGPALVEALRLNQGQVYDARINRFVDNILGAQHQDGKKESGDT